MIAGEATQWIRCSARDAYEFVLDLERYKRADLKIGTVYSVRWHGDEGEVHYSGRLRGLPTPAVRQLIYVEPCRRITVQSKPGTLAHRVSRFCGLFTFEELGDGITRVFHREEFTFLPPCKWLLEPLLRSWLETDTPQEVLRMKTLLEAPAARPGA
jgi:hypothetical protein